MRKLILLYVYAIIGLFVLGCGEADTINPAEDPFSGPWGEEGAITDFKAIVCCLPAPGTTSHPGTCTTPPSAYNPKVVITFISQWGTPTDADASTINYGTSIRVYYDGGVRVEGVNDGFTGYIAIPSSSDLTGILPGKVGVPKITIDLSQYKSGTPPMLPPGTHTIRIYLGPEIKSLGGHPPSTPNNPLSNPGDYNITIP